MKAPADGGGSGASTYTVQAGDNLSSIAVKFGVTVAQLQEWNDISNPDAIQIGQVLIVKAPADGGGSGASTYTVQAGDNLSSIAVKFGVTVAQLQEWNNISDPDAIQIGQVLRVKAPADGGGSGSSTYTVQAGDNLSSIALRFGVTVAQLQEWNNISDPNAIQIGQVLIVKAPTDGGGSGSSTYTVQAGDNLSSIAVKFGVTVAQLQEWNNISDPNAIQIGQVLIVKAPTDGGGSGSSTYTVQAGDNLSSIALRFGVTVAQLQEWNNISDPNAIQIGQVLIVG